VSTPRVSNPHFCAKRALIRASVSRASARLTAATYNGSDLSQPIAKEWHMTQSKSSVALRRAVQVLIAACLPVFAWAGPVDINKADAKTIAKELNGVGLSRAQAIVEFREKNGAFKSIEDLRKVKGIGAKTLEQNRSNIRLDAAETKKAG
jgi:competence protein ComEA